ncbi:hypothetical protein L9F63_014186 [Diploptera punctata]|uniref:Vitellogenin receptor n=1 Tax=Diploptera punctata TaxID=6984 RepID=A0AAD8A8D2_DIPPU|nr:hypothetical protein L9F63_014186 [Diploptera punctata]
MYWTDWQTKALHRADKTNGSDNTIIRGKLEGLMDVRSVQVDNVAENACGKSNGGCSHLCLRTPSSYTCACPTGILLRDDGRTCNTSPSTYLLFATRSTLARVSLDTPELWDVTLPIPDVHNAIAVDFHWKKQKIYYTDVSLDIIRSVDMNNVTSTETVIATNLTTPDGLAVDWIADNIYWTDAGRKVLEVARLDGSCRKVIIQEDLDEPRALAMFPRKGNVKKGEVEKSAVAAHAWSEKHLIEKEAKLLKQIEKPKELTVWEKIYIQKSEKKKLMNFEFPGGNDLVSRFFSQPMEGEKDSSSRRQNNSRDDTEDGTETMFRN